MTTNAAPDPARLHADLAVARMQSARDLARAEGLHHEMRELRRETQHQVRNLLAIVRSLVRRTVPEGQSAEEYQVRLDSRLASITRVQGYLLRHPDKGADLATLAAGELLAFDVGLGAGAQVDGPSICLKPGPAGILSLVFHELARMTIEDGGSAGAGGQTTVRWWIDPDDGGRPGALRIEWRDAGRGMDDATLIRAAFAHDILEQAIPYQLGGSVQLDLTDGTLLCVLRVPIDCTFPA